MKKLGFLVASIMVGFLGNPKASAQVIVIDPGHGYCNSRGGTPSHKHTQPYNHDGRLAIEMATAHDVGHKLKNLLNAECSGWKVYITRPSNERGGWVSIDQRYAMSNSWGADRFISIHTNGGGGTGTETYWCTLGKQPDANLTSFAGKVQKEMVSFGDWRDRGVKEDFVVRKEHFIGVLINNNAIACLSEIGFGDNPKDAAKLGDNNWRKKFAKAYQVALSKSLKKPCTGCQDERTLTGTISSGTYEAAKVLKAAGTISGQSSVVLNAAQEIFLNPGFSTNSGATVVTNLQGCSKASRQAGDNLIVNTIMGQNNQMWLYPNPASGVVTIQYQDTTLTGSVGVQVVDLQGRLIHSFEQRITGTDTPVEIRWDSSNFPQGVYLVSLLSKGQKLQTRKLVIQR